jgi:glycosyltransferase involved in cell wall biosynthesis
VIKAFGKARSMCRFPLNLVIAGSPDPRYPEAKILADQLGLEPYITWTGYIPNENLLKLYQEADLLVHPSQYEGFGLQVVEAMASGLPVLCSNGGALPEVVGNAGITLDPSDEDGYARKIVEIQSDQAKSAEMTRLGIQQAAGFTWRKAADETLKVYVNVNSN